MDRRKLMIRYILYLRTTRLKEWTPAEMYEKLQEMMYMTPEEADFNKFTQNDCRRLDDLIHQGYLAQQTTVIRCTECRAKATIHLKLPDYWKATFTCGDCKPKRSAPRSTAPKRPKRYEKMPKFEPYIDSHWGPMG